jgi:hypothetical protein
MKKLCGYFILLFLLAAWATGAIYSLGIIKAVILFVVTSIIIGLIFGAVILIDGDN